MTKELDDDPSVAPALVLPKDLPLGEAVYRALRTAVEGGGFPPGTRMRENSLADMLGVSRTPIREALRRLLADGMLTQTSSRGLVVTDLDRQQVLELFALREVLEGTAARFAAHRAADSDIDLLHSIIEREKPFLAAGDGESLMHLNMIFHKTIWEAARNRYLLASVKGISDALSLLRGATLDDPDRQRNSHAEHQQIVSAIEQRDAELAEGIAREHIREARRVRLRMLFPAR